VELFLPIGNLVQTIGEFHAATPFLGEWLFACASELNTIYFWEGATAVRKVTIWTRYGFVVRRKGKFVLGLAAQPFTEGGTID
jgi:hypothetical protein